VEDPGFRKRKCLSSSPVSLLGNVENYYGDFRKVCPAVQATSGRIFRISCSPRISYGRIFIPLSRHVLQLVYLEFLFDFPPEETKGKWHNYGKHTGNSVDPKQVA
jgi:hypothetical protein